MKEASDPFDFNDHADIAEERDRLKYVWLSFRDPQKNLNLGVCIVEAQTLREGMNTAWEKKINPGGEVVGYPLTEDQLAEQGLEVNQLYTPEEIREKGFKRIKD